MVNEGDDASSPAAEASVGIPAATLSRALAQTAADFSAKRARLDRVSGTIGTFVGDPDHAPVNIALVAISGLLLLLVVSVVGLMVLIGRRHTTAEEVEGLKTIILSLIALVGTILGYIFGLSGRSDRSKS